jgi:2-polyprenyl-3-methyl-5-hydroxy-6-metoxy-1,4-benzoquinol methylase
MISRLSAGSSLTPRTWTAPDVHAEFARWQQCEPERAQLLDQEARAYVDYHAERYARLLSVVEEYTRDVRSSDRLHVLDIGPNVEVALLRAALPGAVVDTMGFAHPALPPRADECHLEFDLNNASIPDRRPTLERRYDVVVLAEVAEHLYIPLAVVLACVANWLRAGGFVVVQTPNAAALHKRMRLLVGRNPIEPPRACRENPGHLHEYTLSELRDQVAAAGLVVERLEVDNHFGGIGTMARLYRGLGRVVPPTLRHGVTIAARAAL